MLKPIGLTYVEYEEGNLFAMLLAYSSLLPVFIVVGYMNVLFFRRELHTASFFIGQILCEGLTIVLKKIIKEPRPQGNSLTNFGDNSDLNFIS